jgi:hypothetical protein
MPRVEFEPTILAFERGKTVHAATVIDSFHILLHKKVGPPNFRVVMKMCNICISLLQSSDVHLLSKNNVLIFSLEKHYVALYAGLHGASHPIIIQVVVLVRWSQWPRGLCPLEHLKSREFESHLRH